MSNNNKKKTTSEIALEELKRRNDLESLRKFLIAEQCFPTMKDPETAPITVEELKKLVRVWKLNERRNFWKTHSERDDIVSALIQYAEQNHMDNYRQKSNKKGISYSDNSGGNSLKPIPPNETKPLSTRNALNYQASQMVRNFCGLKYFNRENNSTELTISSRFFEFPDLPDRVDNVVDRWRSEDFDLNESDFFGNKNQQSITAPNYSSNVEEEQATNASMPTNFPSRTGANNSGAGANNSQSVVSGIKNKVKVMKQRNLALHLMNYSASNDFKKNSVNSNAVSNSANPPNSSPALSMKSIQTFLNLADSDDIKTISKVMISLSNISSDSMIRTLLLEMNSMHKITNMLPYLRGKIAHYAASLFFYYFSIDKESEDRIYNASSVFLQANYNSKDSQIRLITLYTLNNLMPCIDRQRIAECICRALYSSLAVSSTNSSNSSLNSSGRSTISFNANNENMSSQVLLMDKSTISMYLHIIQNTCWFSNVHHIVYNCHLLDVITIITQYATHYKYSDIVLAVIKVLQSLLQIPEQFITLTTTTPSSSYLPSNAGSNPSPHTTNLQPSQTANSSNPTNWIFSYLNILNLLYQHELNFPSTSMNSVSSGGNTIVVNSLGGSNSGAMGNPLENPLYQLLKITTLLTSLPSMKKYLRGSGLLQTVSKIVLTRSNITNIIAKEINKCFLSMTLFHPDEKLLVPSALNNSTVTHQILKDYYLEKLCGDQLPDAIFFMLKSSNIQNTTKAMSLKALQNLLSNGKNAKNLLHQTLESMLKLMSTLTDANSLNSSVSNNSGTANQPRTPGVSSHNINSVLVTDLRLSVMAILYNVACFSFGKELFLTQQLHYKLVDMLLATHDLSFKSKILQILVLLTSPSEDVDNENITSLCKKSVEDLLQYQLILKLTTQLMNTVNSVPAATNTISGKSRSSGSGNSSQANPSAGLENYAVWKDISHLLLAVVAYSITPLSFNEHINIVKILRVITTSPPSSATSSSNNGGLSSAPSDPYYDVSEQQHQQNSALYYMLVLGQYQEILENTGKIMKYISYAYHDFSTMDPILRNMLQYSNFAASTNMLGSSTPSTNTKSSAVNASGGGRPTTAGAKTASSLSANTSTNTNDDSKEASTNVTIAANDADNMNITDKEEEMLENVAIILYNLMCSEDNLLHFISDISYSNVIIQSLRHGKRLTTLTTLIQCIRLLSSSSDYVLLLLKHNLLSDLIVIALLRTNYEEMKLICSEIFYNMLCHNSLRLKLLQSGDIYWALMRLGRHSSAASDNHSNSVVTVVSPSKAVSQNTSTQQLLQEVKLICIRTIFDLSICPTVLLKWLMLQNAKPKSSAQSNLLKEEDNDGVDFDDDLEIANILSNSIDLGEESVEVDDKVQEEFELVLEAIRKHHVLSFMKDMSTNLSSQYLYYVLQIIHNLLLQFQELTPVTTNTNTLAMPAVTASIKASQKAPNMGNNKLPENTANKNENSVSEEQDVTITTYANHEIVASIRISADAIHRSASHLPTLQIALIVLLKCAQYIKTIPEVTVAPTNNSNGNGSNISTVSGPSSIAITLINEFINIDLIEILKKQIGVWYQDMELCIYISRIFYELSKYGQYVKMVNYEDLYVILQAVYYTPVVSGADNKRLVAKPFTTLATNSNGHGNGNSCNNLPTTPQETRLELLENNLCILMNFVLAEAITNTRILALPTSLSLSSTNSGLSNRVFFPLITILIKDALNPKVVSASGIRSHQKLHASIMAVRASVYLDPSRQTRIAALNKTVGGSSDSGETVPATVSNNVRARNSVYVQNSTMASSLSNAAGGVPMISQNEFLSMMKGRQPHAWRIQGLALSLLAVFIDEYSQLPPSSPNLASSVGGGSGSANSVQAAPTGTFISTPKKPVELSLFGGNNQYSVVSNTVATTYQTLVDEEMIIYLLKSDFVEFINFRNNFLYILSTIAVSSNYSHVFCGGGMNSTNPMASLSSNGATNTNTSTLATLISELFNIFIKYINLSKGNNRQDQAFEYISCFLRNIALHTSTLPFFLSYATALPVNSSVGGSAIVAVIKELCDSLSPTIAYDLTIFFFHISNYLSATLPSGNGPVTHNQEMNQLTPKFVLAMIQILLNYSDQMLILFNQQQQQSSRGTTPANPVVTTVNSTSSNGSVNNGIASGSNTVVSSFIENSNTTTTMSNSRSQIASFRAAPSNSPGSNNNPGSVAPILNSEDLLNIQYINKYTISIILNKYQFVNGVDPLFIQNMLSYMQSNIITLVPDIMQRITFKILSYVKYSTAIEFTTAKDSLLVEFINFPPSSFSLPSFSPSATSYQCWQPIITKEYKKSLNVVMKHFSQRPILFTQMDILDFNLSANLNIVPFQKIIKSFDLIKENQPDASAITEETEQDDDEDNAVSLPSSLIETSVVTNGFTGNTMLPPLNESSIVSSDANDSSEIFMDKESVDQMIDDINKHLSSVGNISTREVESVSSSNKLVHAPTTAEQGSFQSPRSQRIKQQNQQQLSNPGSQKLLEPPSNNKSTRSIAQPLTTESFDDYSMNSFEEVTSTTLSSPAR